MYRTILVPVDGSPLSERALPFATRLAGPGSTLVLVRSTAERQLSVLEPWAVEQIVREQLAAPERVERELMALANQLRAQGLQVESHLSYEDPADSIAEAARGVDADVIVMSTHGRSGLGRWLYGSVADRVMRRAPAPVLLVPAACECVWPSDRPLRLLVTLDGSDLARYVLEPAAAFAEAISGEVVLLRVVEPPEYTTLYGMPPISYDVEVELGRAREYLDVAAAKLRGRGVRVQVQADSGAPASIITAVAREQQVDVIAMATHGRGGLTRFLMGSVATEVLHRVATPMLLVRPVPARKPVAAPAAEDAADESAAPAGPTTTLALTHQDLDLLERGLKELIFAQSRDWRLARPARELLVRLQTADASLAGGEAQQTTPESSTP
jgi:nucleotide-binding universal stress UspA family protein